MYYLEYYKFNIDSNIKEKKKTARSQNPKLFLLILMII